MEWPPPPIDRIHIKTSWNFAQKCIIFAKIFWAGGSAPPFCPLFQISGSATEHWLPFIENCFHPNWLYRLAKWSPVRISLSCHCGFSFPQFSFVFLLKRSFWSQDLISAITQLFLDFWSAIFKHLLSAFLFPYSVLFKTVSERVGFNVPLDTV